MRKSLFLAASILAAGIAIAQKGPIEGNGNIITKEIPVKSFESLKASGVYELKLSQGDKEAVTIEADENLQQYFNVHNEESQLVIEMKDIKDKNIKLKNKLRVYVRFKNLKEMDLSTVGNIQSDGLLTFANLDIKNKSVGHMDLALSATSIMLENGGVGKVKLSGKAQTAVLTNSGVGNLDAGGFVVQTLRVDNSGVGHAEVNADKELTVKDNRPGNVKNKGAAPVKKNNRVEI